MAEPVAENKNLGYTGNRQKTDTIVDEGALGVAMGVVTIYGF